MRALVTGSAGHLGEAMVRTLLNDGLDAVGVDIKDSAFTTKVGSIVDRDFVRTCMEGVGVVYHTATLHKPHVATHSMQDFVDTNITGTLNLLDSAVEAGIKAFIFTSTTSVFGDAMVPRQGDPAVWVTEEVIPVPKNIYGVTKAAAEDLCRLFSRDRGLPCIVLRTSRFFPEDDDDPLKRQAFCSDNLKVNEFLHRRVDTEDVVTAHLRAGHRAEQIGFGRYIVSATSPFESEDLHTLRADPARVVQQYVPEYVSVYKSRNWKMFEDIERVYDNSAARRDLEWMPKYDFRFVVGQLANGGGFGSSLASEVGSKGYHTQSFEDDGPYPTSV